ncbi:MAG: glycoside hydrolase family 2 TIM barrel-domain containing protein [Candidatus Limivivens sp.]|nr:glycoside hydrolase family 2 TIM barrel-domain containing protein [Candidatus Limivivens sp.]
MREIPFHFNWKRTLGKKMPWEKGQEGETVDLPDDFLIDRERSPEAPGGPRVGYFPDGYAVYEKEFRAQEDWRGKRVFLNLDGAYMNTEITFNDHYLGHHPYGYAPFQKELTGFLRFDVPNKLSISVQGHQPSSRWYSGAGIYREVRLLVGEVCCLNPGNLFITTPEVEKERAVVRVEAEISNYGKEDVAAKVRVILKKDGLEQASMEQEVWLKANERSGWQGELEVENPILWDDRTPELYELSVGICAPGQEEDRTVQKIGIRKIEFSPEEGMKVNGRPVTLYGGCIHHDQGMLGAKAFPRAEERKIEKLKAAGFNAVRTAHNPPSRALLEACDRCGIYVLDEMFDCWRIGKNQNDYHLWFEDWWKRDLEATMRRDRNHPSVYCWSFGNEIPEVRNFHPESVYWTKVQADFIRSLDPSRPVTLGGMFLPKNLTCDGFPGGIRGPVPEPGVYIREEEENQYFREMIEQLDIVSFNYGFRNYEQFGKLFPGKVLQGTETEGIDTWGNREAVRQNPFVIGDFVWTAYDNLGEAGAGRSFREEPKERKGLMAEWPWLTCAQADLALDGERLPRSYYRKVIWGLDAGIHVFAAHPEDTGKPLYGTGFHWHEVKKNWTFEQTYIGQPVEVEAYADCELVEFLVNGRSAARVVPEEMTAKAVIPYEPGELRAIAWRNGSPAAEDKLETTGKAVQILLKPDRYRVCPDGMDLSYVEIILADEKGRRVRGEDRMLTAVVSGAGRMEGFGSNNPCTEENFGTGCRRSWEGRAILVVRTGQIPGEVKVNVSAEGLTEGECILHAEWETFRRPEDDEKQKERNR